MLEGARAAALDAVDTATCVYGTDEGHAVAVCFPAQQPTPHVVPLGEAGAGVLAFFGRGQAAAAVVVISSCLCDDFFYYRYDCRLIYLQSWIAILQNWIKGPRHQNL